MNTDHLQRMSNETETKSEIARLKFELLMVSKLASDQPEFFNPLNAALAKNIRDRVLENREHYLEVKPNSTTPNQLNKKTKDYM